MIQVPDSNSYRHNYNIWFKRVGCRWNLHPRDVQRIRLNLEKNIRNG